MEGQVLCFATSTVISGHLRGNIHGRTKRMRWQWEEQEDLCDARTQSRLAAGETSRVGTSHLREERLQDYFSSSCLFVFFFFLVPAITPWFVHSLELDCHDWLHGGSCEEPPTCERWMWSSATGVGVWRAHCQTLEGKAAIETIKEDVWNSSSGSSGFLHHRSKCLLQQWGSSVTLMKAPASAEPEGCCSGKERPNRKQNVEVLTVAFDLFIFFSAVFSCLESRAGSIKQISLALREWSRRLLTAGLHYYFSMPLKASLCSDVCVSN